MSVDRIGEQSPVPVDADRHREAACAGEEASSPVVDGELSRVVVIARLADTVEALLVSVARGDHEAFVALQRRMAGLVRLNVRRVLRDASRSEAVTQETFAEVRKEAYHFDPDRESAQTWVLTRAHEHATEGLGCRDEG